MVRVGLIFGADIVWGFRKPAMTSRFPPTKKKKHMFVRKLGTLNRKRFVPSSSSTRRLATCFEFYAKRYLRDFRDPHYL